MDNTAKRGILTSILGKVKKTAAPAMGALSAFRDKIGGVTRYDSKMHVNSAPEMIRRKLNSKGSSGDPKTFTQYPKGTGMPLPKGSDKMVEQLSKRRAKQ